MERDSIVIVDVKTHYSGITTISTIGYLSGLTVFFSIATFLRLIYVWLYFLSNTHLQSVLHGTATCRITVTADEVLQKQLRVSEVGGLVVVGLTVNACEGFFEILIPPHKAAEVCVNADVPSCLKRYSFCFTSYWARSQQYSSKRLILVICVRYLLYECLLTCMQNRKCPH
jgi:hypothetical protein